MKPEKIERRPSSEERLETLRDLFPEVFTDGRVSVERLKELLEDGVSDAPADEHYGLTWPGKQQARRLANQPPHVTLRPVPGAGVDEATTGNMVLVGDNLRILLALQKSYANSIKLVYIDPPYNTGNDFIYKDTFAVDEELYLQETRQADLNGRLVSNPQTSGRFHSKWLSFMYPRLKLARQLLRRDGVLCVSIGDQEVHNLRHLLDEIFGVENFEGHIHWRRRHNQPNDPTKMLGLVAEHILVYSREKAFLRSAGVGKIGLTGKFSNSDGDSRGPWATKPWKVGAGQSGSRYKIKTPDGRTFEEDWMGDESTFQALLADNRIVWPAGKSGHPRKKYFQAEREEEGQCATNWWPHDQFGSNQEGSKELERIFDGNLVFDNPKPTQLVSGLMQIANVSDGDFVLDFFAGSGTTGHSVFLANAADEGSRRFVLVQLDVAVDEKTKSGAGAATLGLNTIDKITCERLRRVAKAMKAEGVKGDLGFRVFKEDSPALARPLHLAAEQLEKGQLAMFKEKLAHVQPADLFTEVLLLLGFPLDAKREQVPQGSANTLWRFEHPRVPQPLLLCLDSKIDEDLLDALRERRNHTFVCRDEALTDVAKARFYDALKLADSAFKVL